MGEKRSFSFKGKCPYWALAGNEECGIVKGGMYIPMPEHVRMFCLSTKFYQCRQYIKGCEVIMSQEECDVVGLLGSNDRRRLRRYPEQLYLDLVVCGSEEEFQLMNFKAKSLDVSLGGLRIESYKEFAKDDVVSFVMDPEFSSAGLLGVGEVKWCRPQENTNKYECGIAFSNYSTSENMREFLEL